MEKMEGGSTVLERVEARDAAEHAGRAGRAAPGRLLWPEPLMLRARSPLVIEPAVSSPENGISVVRTGLRDAQEAKNRA